MTRVGISAPAALVEWLSDRACVRQPVHLEDVAGGRSNRTSRLEAADGRRWALRRPPLGANGRGAHDVVREARITAQVGRATRVPVASVIGTCDDTTLIGSTFAVSTWVEGLVLRGAADSRRLSPRARARASRELVDALAELHRADPRAFGVDTERARSYFARQLDRWREQVAGAGVDEPELDRVHAYLVAELPEDVEPGIVHGDFRIDNAIVGEDGRLLAVLDWELATVGAPLADIGQFAAYWLTGTARSALYAAAPPTQPAGFADRSELLERYRRQSGRSLAGLNAATAFAKWKAACAMFVIARRASDGHPATIDPGITDFPARARQLLDEAHADLARA